MTVAPSQFFQAAIKRISPPWLQRTVGGAVMKGIAIAIDAQADQLANGVRARFPGLGPDDALPKIGNDRVITRGPSEPVASYARRLRGWWDAHSTQGGPYALLAQLFAYWKDTGPWAIELVYASGTRYSLDTLGNVTRDAITWTPDGSGHWSRIWLFFHVPAQIQDLILGDTGDNIVGDTDSIQGGLDLLTSGGVLPASLYESFRVVPRQWTAAHVEQTTIVLLWPNVSGGGRLWGYPQPNPVWGSHAWQQTAGSPITFTLTSP